METDVLIVGGGLAGCATAYYLAREGVEVTLIERLDLNTQASGSNAGSLHAQIPHPTFIEEGEPWARRFAPVVRLLMQSIELWKGLEQELEAELEVAITGGILVAETQDQMRDIERKARIERSQGLTVEMLTGVELRRLAPYVSEKMIGGAFCPSEGKANPLRATPAFAAAAMRNGARILRSTELKGLSAGRQGYLAETSGRTIRARRVVNCAGAEAGKVAAMLGVELAVRGHLIQVSVTEPVEPLIAHLVYFAGDMLTLKQARNGSLLIGGGWPAELSSATGRPVVDSRSLLANLNVAQTVVPRVGSVRLLRTWPATVNGTADWLPILGEVPGSPGFYVCMFPWMGFTAGPIAARITADLVLGRRVSAPGLVA